MDMPAEIRAFTSAHRAAVRACASSQPAASLPRIRAVPRSHGYAVSERLHQNGACSLAAASNARPMDSATPSGGEKRARQPNDVLSPVVGIAGAEDVAELDALLG